MPKTETVTQKKDAVPAVTHEQTTRPETAKPTYQQISQKAYELWEERGRQDGGHAQDWEKAESDLQNS